MFLNFKFWFFSLIKSSKLKLFSNVRILNDFWNWVCYRIMIWCWIELLSFLILIHIIKVIWNSFLLVLRFTSKILNLTHIQRFHILHLLLILVHIIWRWVVMFGILVSVDYSRPHHLLLLLMLWYIIIGFILMIILIILRGILNVKLKRISKLL